MPNIKYSLDTIGVFLISKVIYLNMVYYVMML